MSAEAVPAWLAAWHEQRGQPQPKSAAVPVKRERQRPAPPPRTVSGIIEPQRWPYDGGVRRESVLDTDFHPPRVVRNVGWRACLKCKRPFFSDDVLGLRLCDGPYGCRGEPLTKYRRKAAVLEEKDDT
jgi:hypothetical protein